MAISEPGLPSRLGRVLGYGWPAGLLVLAVVFLADSYGSDPHAGEAYHAFSSDDLYTVDICRQALAGYDLRGCHFPAAPYVFPDMVLQVPGMAISADVASIFLSYSLLFYGLLAAMLAWIAWRCGVPWPESWLHGCTGVALLLATHLAGPYRDRMILLAHPGNHAGIILVGLFLTALALELVRVGPRPLTTAAFFLVGGLAAFSDRLLIVQFLAPLGLALLVLTCFRLLSVRRLAAGAAWISGSLLLSEAVRWAFSRLGFLLLPVGDDLQLPGFPDIFRFLVHQFPAALSGQYVALTVLAAGALAAVAAVVSAARGRRPEALLVALVCILAGLSSLAAVLVVGLGPMASYFPRYLLVLVFLPFLFFSLLVRLLFRRWERIGTILAVAAAIVAFLQVGLKVPAFAWEHLRQPYPVLVRAIDNLAREQGCRYGLANYWSARSTTLLSRQGVVVKPLDVTGTLWLHSDNPNTCLQPGDETLPPYRFIIMPRTSRVEQLSRSCILARYGEPGERRVVDAEWEIWRYNRLDCPWFNRFLAGVLAQKYRRTHHYEVPQSPPQLAQPTANLSRWDDRKPLSLGPGNEQEVLFDHLLTGEAIDLSADCGNVYQVTFFRDKEYLGAVRAPACATGVVWNYDRKNACTMFSRILPLPEEMRGRPWNRAIVRCLSGAEHARLGHFLVLAESPPLPDLGRTRACYTWRFEAEELPGGSVPFVADALEASASGGWVRRARKEFVGHMVYGPSVPLAPGRYRVDFALRAEGKFGPTPVGHIDAAANHGASILASRELNAEDVQAEQGFRTISLLIELEHELDKVEFRLFTEGGTVLTVDYVDLIPLAGKRGAGAYSG